MSTHPIPDLMQLWRKGDLTAEQAVGHMLQNWVILQQQLADLEKRLRQLEQPPASPGI